MSTFNPSDLSNYVNFLNEHITKDQCLPDHYKFVRNIGYSFQWGGDVFADSAFSYSGWLMRVSNWAGLRYSMLECFLSKL
jgi:hypothetical protein